MTTLENLPKDVLSYLALKLDVNDVLSLCKTSKKYNRSLCLNNTFWVNKLKKDYNIDFFLESEVLKRLPKSERLRKIEIEENIPAKLYYFEITNWLEQHKTISLDILYYDAALDNRIDLVKIALDRGAQINFSVSVFKSPIRTFPPLIKALYKDNMELFNLLLQRGALD